MSAAEKEPNCIEEVIQSNGRHPLIIGLMMFALGLGLCGFGWSDLSNDVAMYPPALEELTLNGQDSILCSKSQEAAAMIIRQVDERNQQRVKMWERQVQEATRQSNQSILTRPVATSFEYSGIGFACGGALLTIIVIIKWLYDAT